MKENQFFTSAQKKRPLALGSYVYSLNPNTATNLFPVKTTITQKRWLRKSFILILITHSHDVHQIHWHSFELTHTNKTDFE